MPGKTPNFPEVKWTPLGRKIEASPSKHTAVTAIRLSTYEETREGVGGEGGWMSKKDDRKTRIWRRKILITDKRKRNNMGKLKKKWPT